MPEDIVRGRKASRENLDDAALVPHLARTRVRPIMIGIGLTDVPSVDHVGDVPTSADRQAIVELKRGATGAYPLGIDQVNQTELEWGGGGPHGRRLGPLVDRRHGGGS